MMKHKRKLKYHNEIKPVIRNRLT